MTFAKTVRLGKTGVLYSKPLPLRKGKKNGGCQRAQWPPYIKRGRREPATSSGPAYGTSIRRRYRLQLRSSPLYACVVSNFHRTVNRQPQRTNHNPPTQNQLINQPPTTKPSHYHNVEIWYTSRQEPTRTDIPRNIQQPTWPMGTDPLTALPNVCPFSGVSIPWMHILCCTLPSMRMGTLSPSRLRTTGSESVSTKHGETVSTNSRNPVSRRIICFIMWRFWNKHGA